MKARALKWVLAALRVPTGGAVQNTDREANCSPSSACQVKFDLFLMPGTSMTGPEWLKAHAEAQAKCDEAVALLRERGVL